MLENRRHGICHTFAWNSKRKKKLEIQKSYPKSRRSVNPFLLILSASGTFSILWFSFLKVDSSTPQTLPFSVDKRSEWSLASTTQYKQQKPRFFLHIGPHKTATTSIQCALYHYKDVLKKKDMIVFLGKVDGRFCTSKGKGFHQDNRIRKLDECIGNADCWSTMIQEWDDYRRTGFDMVLSKESISDLASVKHTTSTDRTHFWNMMEQALVDWNVTVVLTYRRYFEWLTSAFNQDAFHKRIQVRQRWPQSPLLPSTVDQVVAGVINGELAPPYPFVDEILKWKFPSKWNIHVMNMHRTSDVVRAFLCHEILNAANACAIYNPVLPSRPSSSDDLVFDYLNVQALHWGWMRDDRRGHLARSTRTFVKNVLKLSTRDFPKDCPPMFMLESFLNFSMAMERQILGKVDAKDHTERFWKSSGNLCTVNATKVLLTNETLWKKFYQSLYLRNDSVQNNPG